MKKIFTTLSLCLIAFSSNAQWLGSYWTADDMNGNTHVLQNHIDESKAVLVDISAHWCGPCFDLHESHSMAGVYHDFGPDGTNEVMVFFTDVDAGSSIPILQGGSGSQGDWITGTEYPIIGPNGQGAHVDGFYNGSGVPTLYLHCDNSAPVIGTSYDWWTLYATIKGSCPSAFTYSGADASLLKHAGIAGCPGNYYAEVSLYNASSNTTLTSADIELRSPSGQLLYTENWSGSLSPLNKKSVSINYIITSEGAYTAKVTNPNGITDSRPTGDEEIVNVIYAFDNAYWLSDITVNVGGSSSTSWYLKSGSAGVIGSGFGGVPENITISADECYELLVIQGSGETFEITDANGVCTSGIANGPQYSAYFGSGGSPWTGIEEELLSLKLYPNPANNTLNVEGNYDAIQVFDILGKLLIDSEAKEKIDVSSLNSGVYIVELKLNNKSIRKELQITR